MPRLVERTRKRNSSVIYSFFPFYCSTRCSSPQHIHHPCQKSVPFLYFSRDHLLSRIICGSGDHLRYCTTQSKPSQKIGEGGLIFNCLNCNLITTATIISSFKFAFQQFSSSINQLMLWRTLKVIF